MRPFVGEAVTVGARLSGTLDRGYYFLTLALLSVLDWLHPPQETPH
jgi:hypothetical protein